MERYTDFKNRLFKNTRRSILDETGRQKRFSLRTDRIESTLSVWKIEIRCQGNSTIMKFKTINFRTNTVYACDNAQYELSALSVEMRA